MFNVKTPRIAATLGAAMALSNAGAEAAGRHTYVVPPSDGYGIAECFTGERDCARVVADAWCEAHGDAPAIAYGLTADSTGSITLQGLSEVASNDSLRGAIIINCGE